ncbi:ABC transporter ATP-binding protein/permease [Allokutzneria sp. A3M-2-11 16]|uniref:ABC transporter ATP-binding protein n=1 Tax=Allokutzneria sp. A3M-2-11 16 TaxID=2962043 RepID=UPI0020B85E15|nr:ABC transporter ATP-binding protein [Allokutzneria sp. A3M-2-11 16]MCP3802011.1 ABC transporter ATP-binding protein/permease [Allokutzneria sp. A3M-2-11 16]
MRVLWSFVRPHRRVLLLGLVLGLLTTGATLAAPMVTKWVLDGLAASASIAAAVWILVALLLFGSAMGLWQGLLLGKLAAQIVLDARRSMVRRLFRVRVEEIAGRSSGELVTRVTSDTVLLREAAASSVIESINAVVGLIGALVLMAVLDWVLLATTLGALTLISVVVAMLMPRIALAQRDAQAAVGRMGGLLEGALRAIRTVKASRAEGRESARVLAEAEESAKQGIRAVRIEAYSWTVAGMGIQLVILLILALGAWRVSTGAIAVSSLVAFLLYAFRLMEPVESLTRNAGQLQSGIAAAERIREVQALEVEQDGETLITRRAAENEPVLSFHEVTARYAPGSAPALDGVSFDVPRRGHTAIVGPSGAGKTTIFSLMLLFLHPERGHLTLDGVPFDQWSVEDVRKRVVYVEQDTPLLPGTLRENLLYTHGDADEDAIWAALRAVRLEERARALPDGLDTPLASATISGGERQRIALARALVDEPEILLLDEATAQLDGLTESAVHEAIERISQRGAVVTIAHRLSTVIDADRIFVMEAGRCRASGSHAELIGSDALYRDLVASLRIATSGTAAGPVA